MRRVVWVLRLIIGPLAVAGFVAGMVLSVFGASPGQLTWGAKLIMGSALGMAWAFLPRVLPR